MMLLNDQTKRTLLRQVVFFQNTRRPMKRIGCIFALSLCPVSAVLAAPPLPAYKIDIQQTSVSGVSSGGAMAVQMHVAHSSIMRGVGVIAGVAYGCVDPRLPLAAPPGLDSRVVRGLWLHGRWWIVWGLCRGRLLNTENE